MTFRQAIPVVLLMALCGCDRLSKGFRSLAPGANKMMVSPPARPIAPALPPVAEPPVETVDPAPLPEAASATEAAQATPAAADPSLILYEDSFADVAGSIRRKIDGKQQPGEGAAGTRTVYTFQAMPEDGTLTLRIFEDNKTAGPDGEPGLLAVAWDELPKKLDWSGFVYLGGAKADRRRTLPKLQAARTIDDLRSMRLKFRYRGINSSNDSPVQLQLNCRFEPALNDSYNRRIEFGTLVATDEWESFDVSLGDGKNLEAFLKMLAEEQPPGFKIVFGQSGAITNYHAGDTLLIDDVSVTSVAAVAGE